MRYLCGSGTDLRLNTQVEIYESEWMTILWDFKNKSRLAFLAF